MRTIVIYGGRFHPFHKGHRSVYEALTKKFGDENVYVVSSGKQAPVSSPFSFEEKKKMMELLGIPGDKIVEVKNPYMPREITDHVDPDQTAIVFAVSEKDAERFSFAPKKDGSPSYMQPLSKKLKPLSQHGYVYLLPTLDFSLGGRSVRSASEIRALYLKSDDKGRTALLIDLYGPQGKKLKPLFDKRLSLIETILRLSKQRSWLLEDRAATVLRKARLLEAKVRLHEFRYKR
jgi:cytidyltransferase-like protein